MKIKIHKGIANGEVLAPASKSMAHRLLIAAAMCDGESTVRRVPECEDVLATVDCLRSMGVKITRCGEDMRVRGINFASAPRERKHSAVYDTACPTLRQLCNAPRRCAVARAAAFGL